MLKVLVFLTYYNRPLLLKNTLSSLVAAAKLHKKWHLVFCDDGSPIPGEPIVRDILKDHLKNVTFHNTGQSVEDKLAKGLILGKVANTYIEASDADILVSLADDDELTTNCLKDVTRYFEVHPEVMYGYTMVNMFNPFIGGKKQLPGRIHQQEVPLDPTQLSISQIALRIDCCTKFDIRYSETTRSAIPPLANKSELKLFRGLYKTFGPAQPLNVVAQYKGMHDYQLRWYRRSGTKQLLEYYKDIETNGGSKF